MTADHSVSVALATVVTALDTAVRSVQCPAEVSPDGVGPDGVAAGAVTVSSAALMDASDLDTAADLDVPASPDADLLFLTGDAAQLLARQCAERTRTGTMPAVIAVRENALPRTLPSLALEAGCAVIVLDSRTRWDVLLPRVHQVLTGAAGAVSAGTDSSASSLEELAVLLADEVGGLVTIEDTGNRVLAYSPSLNAADDIRARAILGREATAPVMALFSSWNVVDTVNRTAEVVRVPADEGLGTHSRLITGIHHADGTPLGSIWVQEGPDGFTPDASSVLRGGAVTAAAVMQRTLDGSDREDAVLRRLFGEHGPADAAVAADMLQITVDASAVVIGIAAGSGITADAAVLRSTVKRMRIHVGALWTDARVALLGRRIYLLLPRVPGRTDTSAWALQLLERFDDRDSVRALELRAAIATVDADGYARGIPQARDEVDRVLDSPGAGASGQRGRVTSFDRSRTAVLLSEIVAHLSPAEDFADPRLEAVVDYDAAHGTSLVESLRAYLRASCNARDAARALNLHPNTLRYRITRVEALSGLDLRNPDDRLLTEVGLLVRGL